MVAIAERPTPVLPTRIVRGDFETHVTLTVFECSPTRVIRDVLELRSEDMGKKGKTVGAVWSVRRWAVTDRNKRALTIDVRVGCHCQHDCCGHMCHLTYEITYINGLTIVVTTKGFNY